MIRAPVLLVLRALGLGDLLTAVPALRALARAFVEHRRLLAVPAALAPLARLTGAVDDVVATDALGPLPRRLRPEVAVNLHGRGPQSHAVLLDLRPARLIAFAHPEVRASAGLPAWRAGEHEVARWCRLLGECGIPADPGDLGMSVPGPLPAEARGATIIHPGAGSPARCWPAERWAAVARAERAAGRRVIVSGGPGERALAIRVASAAGVPLQAVVAGRADALGLARLVAAAGRVLSSDTGIAHLATALGTPSVVLFGPTPPSLWGPPADRVCHRVLWAGRVGPSWGAEPDPGLLAITVDDVLEALGTLPGRPAPALVEAAA